MLALSLDLSGYFKAEFYFHIFITLSFFIAMWGLWSIFNIVEDFHLTKERNFKGKTLIFKVNKIG